MSRPSRFLYVAWQDPETRRILPVARVVVDAQGTYEFAYIEAVHEAQQHGFLPLLSFPDLQEVYRSHDLIPLLHNRLLQNNRPDYHEYLHELALDASSAEPFTVLARSGGRRTTDRLELFSPPAPTADGRLGCIVLARGVRHVPGAEEVIAELHVGTRLEVVVDAANPHNPKALKLRNAAGFIGFLPDYLASELACTPAQLDVIVRKLNPPPAPVHHRVLLEVTLEAADPRPFSGRKYAPLSADAWSFAA
jgi:hypothetical protein